MENTLVEENNIVLFENKKIRRKYFNNDWYYSVVDVIEVLTESKSPSRYWNELKYKLEKEDFQLFGKIEKLKIISKDGKSRGSDCANRETIFRIIQSVPSPNAEPFKLWFAHLAEERIQEVINPELAIERARQTYLKKGYSEEWTNARLKGISVRNELTDEWKNRGANSAKDFAILTDEISKSTFGITTQGHKNIKKINKNANLRDNMSPLELALTTLAEVTTTELHRTNDSYGLDDLQVDAHDGGSIASDARLKIEEKIGKKVITSENAKDFRNKKIDYK